MYDIKREKGLQPGLCLVLLSTAAGMLVTMVPEEYSGDERPLLSPDNVDPTI